MAAPTRQVRKARNRLRKHQVVGTLLPILPELQVGDQVAQAFQKHHRIGPDPRVVQAAVAFHRGKALTRAHRPMALDPLATRLAVGLHGRQVVQRKAVALGQLAGDAFGEAALPAGSTAKCKHDHCGSTS